MLFIVISLALLLTYTIHKLRQLSIRIDFSEKRFKQIEYGADKENKEGSEKSETD